MLQPGRCTSRRLATFRRLSVVTGFLRGRGERRKSAVKPFITIRRGGTLQRECLPLRDMTDCLLQAYDCVARRAYQMFVSRGGQPGGELDDWLNAERELLGDLPVNLEDSGESLSALASLPGLSGKDVDVGIDPRWLVILGHHNPAGDSADQTQRSTEFDEVTAWVSTIHTDARTLRINCRAANSPGSPATRHAPPRLPAHFSAYSDLSVVAVNAGLNAEGDSPKSVSVMTSDRAREPSASSESLDSCTESNARNQANPRERHAASQLFCVLELPVEIDPSRSIAILANDLLGIRMPKRQDPAH